MRASSSIFVLVTAVTLIPAAAYGQASVSAGVRFNSHYVWRGVTSTNRPVIQPDVSVSVPVRSVTFAAGAWGNIEPVRYDGPRDLSSLNGLPGPFITQSEAWLEMSATIAKRVEASFGAQAYLYPHVADLDEYNTVELYALASVDGFVSPSVSINYDVARIRGGYVEAGLSRGITGARSGSVTLGLSAGFSAGQAEDPTGRDLAYFERDGLSHVDASTTATFVMGRIEIAPEAHVIVAHDSLATIVAPDATRRTKLWIGTTLRWKSE
jgi:hypothetical protein